ncbi:NYN domain-containing protein [Actinophytocola xanthii]|nr:NYN domain-containing protein [Actinophytocola xanthii]
MIDAGYVYAAGGHLCCGTRSRSDIVVDASAVVGSVSNRVRSALGVSVLRTYWYDAARDGIRTEEQQVIAGLYDVKLRLGRLNAQNQQKGVDALIYRDMITLAQRRAVTDIVLVSGDEDLREGVRTVQDYGVRVVLVGIEAVRGFNQSRELTYEADRVWTLTKSDLEPLFSRRVRPVIETPGLPFEAAELEAVDDRVVRAAVDFATQWREKAQENELLELRDECPRIPRPLDVELLSAVETATGISLRTQDALKRKVRASWWGVIGPRR